MDIKLLLAKLKGKLRREFEVKLNALRHKFEDKVNTVRAKYL
jgi:CRISPR/Cas system CSM-associated protein Csm3 (group 7 of RAMP superfamily)